MRLLCWIGIHSWSFRRVTPEGRGRWRCADCRKWTTGGVPCPVPNQDSEPKEDE